MRTWNQDHLDGIEFTGTNAAHGMHRRCEIDLLSMISGDMMGICIIGCGHGEEFKIMQESGLDAMTMLGVDRLPGVVIEGAEYWERNIMTPFWSVRPAFIHELTQWRAKIDGPVLWYTDNGYKLAELAAIAPICWPGDVLGTHDFGTEVPLDSVEFLLEMGFEYMGQFDPYIDEHLCLQGFWKRRQDV